MMNKTSSFLITLCLLLSNTAYSDVSAKTQNEIDYLLTYIEQSGCTFNRNGTDYEGNKVISHINTKFNYFEDEIKTTEDFIALSATRSEISGKRYTVRCNNSESVELGGWLLELLDRFRNTRPKIH